jgi:hypothetical protein
MVWATGNAILLVMSQFASMETSYGKGITAAMLHAAVMPLEPQP